jgi:hypothetical protein
MVLIRDFSDSIQIEKVMLKQSEDNARTNLIQSELKKVFSKHCLSVEKVAEVMDKSCPENS